MTLKVPTIPMLYLFLAPALVSVPDFGGKHAPFTHADADEAGLVAACSLTAALHGVSASPPAFRHGVVRPLTVHVHVASVYVSIKLGCSSRVLSSLEGIYLDGSHRSASIKLL